MIIHRQRASWLTVQVSGEVAQSLGPSDSCPLQCDVCDIAHDIHQMSARKLGGGRILGSGKSLAPPAQVSSQHRTSPSESTLSSSTSASRLPSPPPPAPQDIGSRVSLSHGGPAGSAASAAPSKLSCPICEEEMVSAVLGGSRKH